MQYVICYDIADDRRRDRVSNTLLDFGPKVQESVHWATLDEELAERMVERLKGLIDEAADRVHVFALCAACASKMVTMGTRNGPKWRIST